MEPYMTEEVQAAPDAGAESTAAPASTPAVPAAPAATPEMAKPGTGTVLDGVSDKPVATPANWPENWRDLVSQDEKERKGLDRYATPADIWKKARELEKKISTGKFKADLPEKPTEEQLAAYRKDMGIPEDGKYDVEIGGGFVWADEDKPNLEFFAKRAHELNMPQGEFKKSLQVYADLQNKALADMADRDNAVWKETEDSLRAEWGHEFRANMNMLERMFPPEIVEEVFTARGPSGVKLGGNKEVLNFLAGFMKKYAPEETIVPGGAGNAAAESEFEALDRELAENPPQFQRDPKKWARWSELHEAKTIREQRERKGRAA
jgi:hypothetical protein